MAEGGVLARASRPRRYSQGWRSRYRESLPCHRLLSSRRHCSTCDPPHEQLLARLGTGGAAFIVGGGCRVVPRGVRWCWDCSSPLSSLSSSGSTLVLALTRLITGVGCVPGGYPTSWVSLLLSSPSRHPSLSAVSTHDPPGEQWLAGLGSGTALFVVVAPSSTQRAEARSGGVGGRRLHRLGGCDIIIT
jgi:hypothetical protein